MRNTQAEDQETGRNQRYAPLPRCQYEAHNSVAPRRDRNTGGEGGFENSPHNTVAVEHIEYRDINLTSDLERIHLNARKRSGIYCDGFRDHEDGFPDNFRVSSRFFRWLDDSIHAAEEAYKVTDHTGSPVLPGKTDILVPSERRENMSSSRECGMTNGQKRPATVSDTQAALVERPAGNCSHQ